MALVGSAIDCLILDQDVVDQTGALKSPSTARAVMCAGLTEVRLPFVLMDCHIELYLKVFVSVCSTARAWHVGLRFKDPITDKGKAHQKCMALEQICNFHLGTRTQQYFSRCQVSKVVLHAGVKKRTFDAAAGL